MSSSINVPITEEVARDLQRLRERYPDMSDEALFRFSLLELSHKVELERKQAWADSLPILHLSEEERKELSKTLREADKDPGQIMTVDEIMDMVLND